MASTTSLPPCDAWQGGPTTSAGRRAGERDASAPVPPRVRTLIVDDSESVRDGLSHAARGPARTASSSARWATPRRRSRSPACSTRTSSSRTSRCRASTRSALVRALAGLPPPPAVLVLSAFADAPSARQAIEAGAIGWVLKDSEPDDLFAALLGPPGVATRRDGRRRRTRRAAIPRPDFGAALDARTVWALLRAPRGRPRRHDRREPRDARRDAGRARRALCPAPQHARPGARQRRSTSRRVPRSYLLTSAGRLELARLERRIPGRPRGRRPADAALAAVPSRRGAVCPRRPVLSARPASSPDTARPGSTGRARCAGCGSARRYGRRGSPRPARRARGGR